MQDADIRISTELFNHPIPIKAAKMFWSVHFALADKFNDKRRLGILLVA